MSGIYNGDCPICRANYEHDYGRPYTTGQEEEFTNSKGERWMAVRYGEEYHVTRFLPPETHKEQSA